MFEYFRILGNGAAEAGPGTNFGLIEYWVRLKVPMEQALRLFKVKLYKLNF